MRWNILIALIGWMAIVSLAAAQSPDTLWTQTFGGSDWDCGNSVRQTADGGYIIAGYTESSGAGQEDVLLIKTDAYGNQQWSHTFGGNYEDVGNSVQQTSDGGYVIAGWTYSFGVGWNDDVCLIKTDAYGNQQWIATFGGSNLDAGYSVQQTTDGGYIIAGFTQSYGAGGSDIYLIKTDALGIEQWYRTFGGVGWDYGYSVQQTSDGGYIIAGYVPYGAGGSDVYLIKTDEFGTEQWIQTIGGSGSDHGNSVQQTGDGGYIIAGYTSSYGAGENDVYLIKTDSSGIEQWSQTFGGSHEDYGHSVQQTGDGGYIIAGRTDSYGAGEWDVYIIKTDSSGTEQWSQTFGGSDYDRGYSIQQTSDGGYIIAGETQSYGAGYYDVWLIRLEEEQPNVTLTLTPLNPPIQIPASGGDFSFDLEIVNGTTVNYIIDVSTDITLPSGTTYPLLSREGINLASGATLMRSLTQFVPGWVPARNYNYNGHVYDHNTGELLAEDSFPFEKMGDNSPDTLWTQTFGGIHNDGGYSVQQTTDGGYIVAGYTWSYGSGNSNVYLIKTDDSGIEQWYQTFGGNQEDYGYSVQQTSDGGYIVAGVYATYSGLLNEDVYLVKTDASGIEQWTQTFGGSGGYNDDERGYSVQQTSDGGYIIAGYTNYYGAGSRDVYLIKTDSGGNQQWYQTFGGVNLDEGRSVQQTTDGGYIIAGYTYSYGAGSLDVYLIKTDAFGNEQWSQTFGEYSQDWGNSVQQTSDGGYIIAGWTYSYGAGYSDVWLIKTDASGIEQWNQTFGGGYDDYGYSVQQTGDGGYVIAGETESYGAGEDDVYVIKTDASGNMQWSQTLGGIDDDVGRSVQQTSDGGYVIAGQTSSYGAGYRDVWLIRLEAETVILTLTPLNPLIHIPAGGGSFSFDIEIAHGTAANYTVDVSTDVTLPGGTTYPLLSRDGISLASGTSLIRNLTQWVPGGASAGNYAYNGYVHDNTTGELLAEDRFPFEKLAGDGSSNHNLGWALFGWDHEGAASVNPPAEYALYPASPNPTNPVTWVTFHLPAPQKATLAVYNLLGQKVATLAQGLQPPGTNTYLWNAAGFASGVYIVRLEVEENQQVGKVVVLR